MDSRHGHEKQTAHGTNFDLRFFKRFARLLSWLFPSVKSLPILLFIFILSLSLLEQFVIFNIGYVPSKFYLVLGNKDNPGFWREIGIAIVLIITEAFLKGTIAFITSLLYLFWRKTVSKRLHKMYFKNVVYYTLNVIEKSVDNPDQRITQDVDKLCNTFSQIVAPLLISPFTISYYMYKSHQGSGYIGPVSVIVFFIIATVINKILMSPVVRYVFLREKMEGNFRFKHMQMRVNSESAAFYRAGRIENKKTDERLEQLVKTQHSLVKREYPLNFSINLFDYLGSILSYIAISFPIFLGNYNDLSAPDLSALISANAFVVIYLINCFTKLIDLASKVTDLAGTTHRVVELIEVLHKLTDKQNTQSSSRPNESRGFGWDEMETLVSLETVTSDLEDVVPLNVQGQTAFTVSNITYKPPKATEPLCKDLTFTFEAGVNILVTGDSGCGKSSLLRVAGGLWPEVRGIIDHKIVGKPHTLLFLPQKPYFTDGSLRQQILFPLQEFDSAGRTVDCDDEVMYRWMEVVGLSHLVSRVGGLDVQVDWNWYDELSPGEMQRLSFVRLFYHQPKFAVLDEATSQIGMDAETVMYGTCQKLGITVLSVGHRDSLRQYHNVELHLGGSANWTLQPIRTNILRD